MPAASYNNNPVPADGQVVSVADGKFSIPDHPIIPFIEGDGTGRDIWKASVRVFDAAVEKSYGSDKKIVWYEIFAGEKAHDQFGEWLPDDTLEAIKAFKVAILIKIKGNDYFPTDFNLRKGG